MAHSMLFVWRIFASILCIFCFTPKLFWAWCGSLLRFVVTRRMSSSKWNVYSFSNCEEACAMREMLPKGNVNGSFCFNVWCVCQCCSALTKVNHHKSALLFSFFWNQVPVVVTYFLSCGRFMYNVKNFVVYFELIWSTMIFVEIQAGMS
jgi:hypothetical protein